MKVRQQVGKGVATNHLTMQVDILSWAPIIKYSKWEGCGGPNEGLVVNKKSAISGIKG